MIIDACGFKLNYEIHENSDKSNTKGDIVFLHGWGSSLGVFGHMVRQLEAEYRCILLDLPGFGNSDMPSQPLTLENYCECVYSFIKKLGLDNPIMIGHSNGGRVIISLCSDGRLKPEKIVLFGAAGIKKKKSARQVLRLCCFKTAKFFLTLPLIRNATADLLEQVRSYFGSTDYNSAPPVMRKTLINLINTDLTPRLKNIGASTLLIWGENDTETPLYMAKIMEREIADCGLCVIKGGTHWSFVEYPVQVDAILHSFLGGGDG